jgi:hypothetical protein
MGQTFPVGDQSFVLGTGPPESGLLLALDKSNCRMMAYLKTD